MNNSPETPIISVIICTRNRQDNALHTAKTVLQSDYPNFELIIVDQSNDDTTREALAPLCSADTRLRYFHQDLPGKPRALNLAWKQARGKYLLLTDDDCESEIRWLREIEDAFQSDEAVGCVFGQVIAAPHDTAQGYIVENRIEVSDTISRISEYARVPGYTHFGIGANMAIRADLVARLQGWDPCIGPGTKFRSGDDNDMAVRVLLSGHKIRFCPTAIVTHFGFRKWQSQETDVTRFGFGSGATFIKYLRCGVMYFGSLRVLSHSLFQLFKSIVLFRPRKGLSFVRGWLQGVKEASKHKISRQQYLFQPVEDHQTTIYENQVAPIVLRNQL